MVPLTVDGLGQVEHSLVDSDQGLGVGAAQPAVVVAAVVVALVAAIVVIAEKVRLGILAQRKGRFRAFGIGVV